MKMSKKTLALLAAMVLAIGVAAGSTLAWLTDTTGDVVNTFTTSDVDIELFETDIKGEPTLANSYQMVPGYTITKDPTVIVKADSEKCYVFVKLEKENGFENYMTYGMADGWTELEGVAGVYYRVADDTDADQSYYVIKDNTVSVKDEVTKKMMDDLGIDPDNYPKLVVTAYACQFMKNNTKNFTAAEAWANVNA